MRSTRRGAIWASRVVAAGGLVALGGAGNAQKITTSPDGSAWSLGGQGGITLAQGPREVAWSPSLGLFVAVTTAAGVVWSSPDGLTWTSQSLAGIAPFGVCWSEDVGLFVAVGGSLGIETSPDAVTWTSQLSGAANLRFQAVHWSPDAGLFMAVGTDTTGGAEPCYTSPDGTTWTLKGVPIDPPGAPAPRPTEDVVYAPSLASWLAVGGSGDVGLSTDDGTTWTQYDSAVTGNLSGVDWSSTLSLFVSTGTSIIQSSADGQTWTSRSTAMTGNDVFWSTDLSLFVVVGASGAIYTSSDGASFTSQTSGHSQDIGCVTWGG